MNSRGRGSLSRSSISKKANLLPNLSVAGKREVKVEPGSSRGGSKERRSRGRGGRNSRGSRGRGAERESRKPTFIEQTGIFSSGLNDDGRHDRPKLRDEISTAVICPTKNSGKDVEMSESTELKPITYETEWLSDEEGDMEELTELLRDEFISDLKVGNVKPLVLPLSDEVQFEDLIENAVKKETVEAADTSFSVESSLAVKNESPLRPENNPEIKTEVDDLTSPTSASSREASVLLRNINGTDDDCLMLWQLPSTLSVLASVSKEPDYSASGGVNQNQEKKVESQHCLSGLPSGTELGLLKFRKSGRTELSIGGKFPLDVTCAVPGHHQESVVMIQVEQQRRDGFGQIQNFKTEFPDSDVSGNQIFVLGSLSHAFICSHDFPQSIGMKRRKNIQREEPKSELKEDDSEIQALYAELERIERKEENWKYWASEYGHSTSEDSI